jgi:hypothetical protein
MQPWEQYQHKAAELLRELGFSAEVNADLTETNDAVNAIDVVAHRTVAGVRLLWIVECKYWNKPVEMGAVRELRSLVLDLGADRGLLMSESGFQSGAIASAKGKNITLTSLEDLRANATEELLAARAAAVEQRILKVTEKIIKDLRTFSAGIPHVLPIMASKLSAHDWAELTARDEPPGFFEGVGDLAERIGAAGIGDFVPPGTDLSNIQRQWRPGVDPAVMEMASREISQMAQALDQGKLGNWPVVCLAADGAKLAYGMRQMLQVIESRLAVVEEMVARQEGKAIPLRPG